MERRILKAEFVDVARREAEQEREQKQHFDCEATIQQSGENGRKKVLRVFEDEDDDDVQWIVPSKPEYTLAKVNGELKLVNIPKIRKTSRDSRPSLDKSPVPSPSNSARRESVLSNEDPLSLVGTSTVGGKAMSKSCKRKREESNVKLVEIGSKQKLSFDNVINLNGGDLAKSSPVRDPAFSFKTSLPRGPSISELVEGDSVGGSSSRTNRRLGSLPHISVSSVTHQQRAEPQVIDISD